MAGFDVLLAIERNRRGRMVGGHEGKPEVIRAALPILDRLGHIDRHKSVLVTWGDRKTEHRGSSRERYIGGGQRSLGPGALQLEDRDRAPVSPPKSFT